MRDGRVCLKIKSMMVMGVCDGWDNEGTNKMMLYLTVLVFKGEMNSNVFHFFD
jgi:hypothetical protein